MSVTAAAVRSDDSHSSQTLVDVPDRAFQVLTPSFEPFDVPGLEIEASDGSSSEREENEDSQSFA